MNEFGLPATDEAVEYMREIATAMIALFGIDAAEACGRVRKFWHTEAFLTEPALGALFHRTPESWARNIYSSARP